MTTNKKMSLDEKCIRVLNGEGTYPEKDIKQSIKELMEANIIGRKMLLEKIKEIFGKGLI